MVTKSSSRCQRLFKSGFVTVGTFTGWNLRPRGLAQGDLSGLLGSFIPFAKTKSQRKQTGDPRLSIEERYKDRADYVEQISRAARALVEARYLLAEDAERKRCVGRPVAGEREEFTHGGLASRNGARRQGGCEQGPDSVSWFFQEPTQQRNQPAR